MGRGGVAAGRVQVSSGAGEGERGVGGRAGSETRAEQRGGGRAGSETAPERVGRGEGGRGRSTARPTAWGGGGVAAGRVEQVSSGAGEGMAGGGRAGSETWLFYTTL